MAWGPRLKPLHPVVERFAAMLVPVAPDGLVREVAGLRPLLGAVDEVVCRNLVKLSLQYMYDDEFVC